MLESLPAATRDAAAEFLFAMLDPEERERVRSHLGQPDLGRSPGREPRDPRRPPKGAHILVVDDDRRIRTLLSRYLAAEGYLVSSAADARGGHRRACATSLSI